MYFSVNKFELYGEKIRDNHEYGDGQGIEELVSIIGKVKNPE